WPNSRESLCFWDSGHPAASPFRRMGWIEEGEDGLGGAAGCSRRTKFSHDLAELLTHLMALLRIPEKTFRLGGDRFRSGVVLEELGHHRLRGEEIRKREVAHTDDSAGDLVGAP